MFEQKKTVSGFNNLLFFLFPLPSSDTGYIVLSAFAVRFSKKDGAEYPFRDRVVSGLVIAHVYGFFFSLLGLLLGASDEGQEEKSSNGKSHTFRGSERERERELTRILSVTRTCKVEHIGNNTRLLLNNHQCLREEQN